jgi:hypothetical protein
MNLAIRRPDRFVDQDADPQREIRLPPSRIVTPRPMLDIQAHVRSSASVSS